MRARITYNNIYIYVQRAKRRVRKRIYVRAPDDEPRPLNRRKGGFPGNEETPLPTRLIVKEILKKR